MTDLNLIVSVDVECDKSRDWRTSSPVTFRGVTEGIGEILHGTFSRWGVRPTYLLSPEVMTDIASCDLLRALSDCELGTHLHGDYIVPQITHSEIAATLTAEMQWEYPPEVEEAKLAVLTELFFQQFDHRPVSFRAGRFGIGHNTGKILHELGYCVDSSVTPHVTWTSRSGEKLPDFVAANESPYRISSDGDLFTAGNSSLIELPVTIVKGEGEPAWFRPWYSSAGTMIEIMRKVKLENTRSGSCRPLVMMFHNVEIIPGASPYPQKNEEVQRYLEALEAVFEEAARLNIIPCTMREYYEAHYGNGSEHQPSDPESAIVRTCAAQIVEHAAIPQLKPEIDLDVALFEQIIDRHQVQPWFKHAFKERRSRWDCWEPCHWIHSNAGKESKILSTGTGVGLNLLWLALHGFTDLNGFDIDHKAIAAGYDLAASIGRKINLWLDDGLEPKYLPANQYDVIEALVWTPFIAGLDYGRFLATYRNHLKSGGIFIFDVIDAAYNSVAGNEFCTQDKNLPEADRRVSEYKVRVSEDDVRVTVKEQGFKVVDLITRPQEIPKKVYIVQKI